MTSLPVSTRRVAALGIVLFMFILLVPSVAASSHCESIQEQVQQAFLQNCTENVSMHELLFGIVLPFLLVFSIIHYAMGNLWPDNKKEAAIIALVLAMFPIPTGAYQTIAEIFMAVSSIVTEAQAPSAAFNGTFLEGVTSSFSDFELRVALSLAFGALTAMVLTFFGTGSEARELKKHEITAIIALTAAFWVVIGGVSGSASSSLSQLASTAGVIVIVIVGAALLWAHLEKGGASGAITGFLGLLILAWVLQRPFFNQFGPLQEFGNMVTSGVMWIVGAIVFIIVGVLIMVFHLKSQA